MVMIGGIVSSIILLLLIFLVVYIIFAIGKTLIGLLVNVVLGFISIFLLNSFFALGLPFDLLTIIITALLGLPGVLIIVILKLLGITV